EGVSAVRVDHVLHGVGDQFAAGQGVQHAAVPHGDAVVDRDGVELARHAACRAHRVSHDVGDFAQVHVSGHKLGIAVGHRHDGFAEVFACHAGGAQQRAGTGHVS